MKDHARSLFGGGFASSEQRLEQAAAVESYDVRRPPRVRVRTPRKRRARTRPRSKSFARRQLTRALLASHAALLGDELLEHAEVERPRTRADCAESVRPCPWVACRHHLYLDVNPITGSIKINFPDLDPWELKHTCALDVADLGGSTLEVIAQAMNLTRERIRQIEVFGLRKIKQSGGIEP